MKELPKKRTLRGDRKVNKPEEQILAQLGEMAHELKKQEFTKLWGSVNDDEFQDKLTVALKSLLHATEVLLDRIRDYETRAEKSLKHD
jgi:hypothetical protein